MLLESTLVMDAKLLARLPDLAVVADEELVDEDLTGGLLGDPGEDLAIRRTHVARVHCQFNLCLPWHGTARLDQLGVKLAPRRCAQLVRPTRAASARADVNAQQGRRGGVAGSGGAHKNQAKSSHGKSKTARLIVDAKMAGGSLSPRACPPGQRLHVLDHE